MPLVYKDRVIGVLDLEHTRRGYFNDDHSRTISTLAAQIAIAIENARLYERIAQEEARLERDLAMAREVQISLLPPRVPKRRGMEMGVRFEPAHQIGGDLYDFLEYSKDLLGHRMRGRERQRGAGRALWRAGQRSIAFRGQGKAHPVPDVRDSEPRPA